MFLPVFPPPALHGQCFAFESHAFLLAHLVEKVLFVWLFLLDRDLLPGTMEVLNGQTLKHFLNLLIFKNK